MAELIALTGQPSGFGNFQGWGGGGSAVDWGGIIGGIGGAIGGILADRRRARQPLTAMPFVGGAVGPILGRAAPWLVGGGLGSMLPDIFGGDAGVITPSTPGVFAGGPLDVFRPDFFVSARSSIRARRLIPVSNPVTGNIHYWGHLGQPRWDRGCQHMSVGRKRARRRRKRY